MSDDAQNYALQIAELRAERKHVEQREQLKVIEDNYKTALEWRDDAAESGDLEAWRDSDKWAEELESEYAKLAPPPQSPYGPEDYKWVEQRKDLMTPINKLKLQQYEAVAIRAGIQPGTQAFRDGAEKYISPGLFDEQNRLIPGTAGAIVPVGHEPMPTGDDAFQLTKNSKYGKDLTANEYNRGVRELQRRKANGEIQ